LIDPLNQREIIANTNIILIKDEQKDILFKKLLSHKNNISDKYLNYIMSIDLYFNKLKNILKFLIYFYYYEKDLKENQESLFNDKGKGLYYLINPEWLNKFKNIFNYSDICETLKLINRKSKEINYNNLSKYYDQIISQIDENILDSNNILFDEINIENIKLNFDKIGTILYHKSCYIINSQIMKIIKSIFNDNEINIRSRRIFFMDNNIYIFYEKKAIIGKLNEILLFIPKYIIVYSSKEIFESEKQYLFSNTIENYINGFKCDLNNPNLQILKDKNGNIGKLIILQNGVLSNNKTDNKPKNKSLPKINSSFNKNRAMNMTYKKVNLRTENSNMNKSTDHFTHDENYYQYETTNSNNNSINYGYNIKNNKNQSSNKIKNYFKINKNEYIERKISNEEQINIYNKDNENNNKKINNK